MRAKPKSQTFTIPIGVKHDVTRFDVPVNNSLPIVVPEESSANIHVRSLLFEIASGPYATG